MASSTATPEPSLPQGRPARRDIVPSAVLGMLIFIAAEVMFFAGLMSAFTINRAAAPLETWPGPGEPRLPILSTALNTVLLLTSGAALGVAHLLRRRGSRHLGLALASAWLLGAAFVVLQGAEWVTLLGRGLTLTSSTLGAFFYMIVGAHAAHAVFALAALGIALWRHTRGTLSNGFFFGTELFWHFVVLMWPVIYLRVYF